MIAGSPVRCTRTWTSRAFPGTDYGREGLEYRVTKIWPTEGTPFRDLYDGVVYLMLEGNGVVENAWLNADHFIAVEV